MCALGWRKAAVRSRAWVGAGREGGWQGRKGRDGGSTDLLITRTSDCVMPGPPLRGTLSPPATSAKHRCGLAAVPAGGAGGRGWQCGWRTNHVHGVVGQLRGEVSCEIISTRLAQQEVRPHMHRELLQRGEIGRDVLANGSMWTTACLDGGDALLGERTVAREEFGVLPRLATASGSNGGQGGREQARGRTSLVKMSFVTTAMDRRSRSRRHSCSTRAVFPDPTGPPIPMVKARSVQSRFAHSRRGVNSPRT